MKQVVLKMKLVVLIRENTQFWKRIEDIAFEKKISWNEISRRTGISRQNLIKNRRISTEPRLTTIIRLIDKLEIEPNTLFFS